MKPSQSMNTQQRKRWLRAKLFHQQDGKCYACRQPMILKVTLPKHSPDNMACLTRRELPNPGEPEFTDPRRRLMCAACRKCVNAREHARTLKIPIEQRREAAQRHPLKSISTPGNDLTPGC